MVFRVGMPAHCAYLLPLASFAHVRPISPRPSSEKAPSGVRAWRLAGWLAGWPRETRLEQRGETMRGRGNNFSAMEDVSGANLLSKDGCFV